MSQWDTHDWDYQPVCQHRGLNTIKANTTKLTCEHCGHQTQLPTTWHRNRKTLTIIQPTIRHK